MDGVVTDFVAGYSRLCNSIDPRCNKVIQTQAESWDWITWYSMDTISRPELIDVMEEAWKQIKEGETFWLNLPPLNPVWVESLKEVNDVRPLVFISRRDAVNPYLQTYQWLEQHGIREPHLYIVQSGEEKGDVCKKLGVNVIIEDSPKYADEILDKGIHLIMPEYTYNREYIRNKKQWGFVPVRGLNEALDLALFIDESLAINRKV